MYLTLCTGLGSLSHGFGSLILFLNNEKWYTWKCKAATLTANDRPMVAIVPISSGRRPQVSTKGTCRNYMFTKKLSAT